MKKKISFRFWNSNEKRYWNCTREFETQKHLDNYIQAMARKGHDLDEQYGTL